MGELAAAGIRERIWVTKYDHSTDPPTPIEETMTENGRLVEVTIFACVKCLQPFVEDALAVWDGVGYRCVACADRRERA